MKDNEFYLVFLVNGNSINFQKSKLKFLELTLVPLGTPHRPQLSTNKCS